MEYFKHKYDNLFNPVLQALHKLGRSETNNEIEEQVILLLNLSNLEIEDIHRGNTTKLAYRLAWARNYLKRLRLLENSGRAIWTLTARGQKTTLLNPKEAKKIVKALSDVKKSCDAPKLNRPGFAGDSIS